MLARGNSFTFTSHFFYSRSFNRDSLAADESFNRYWLSLCCPQLNLLQLMQFLPQQYQKASCRNHNQYNPELSNSSYYIESIKLDNNESINEIDVNFALGQVSGLFFEDTLCLENNCFKEFNFVGILSEEPEEIFKRSELDGILGLGRRSQSLVKDSSFINRTNDFSIYLSKDEEKSRIVFGSSNKTYLAQNETLSKFNLSIDNLWSMKLNAIFIGGKRIDSCDPFCHAIIDSGTTVIEFDKKIFEEAILLLPATVPCSEISLLPTIELQFGDKKYEISPKSYMHHDVQLVFSNTCIPLIGESPSNYIPSQSIIILGQPFFYEFFITFDDQKDQLSFGKSIK